jgi:hypothetical protein
MINEDVMKKVETAARLANFATAVKARLGRAVFMAVAALSLGLITLCAPASGQAKNSLSTPQATNALPACGEEFTLLSETGAQSVSAESGAEPGATDPMGTPAGRYMLFPDHEVLAFQPSFGLVRAFVLTTDKGGTTLHPAPYNMSPWDTNGFGPPAFFPAAGRFLKPESDDALFAARRGDPNKTDGAADVAFFGGSQDGFFRTFSAILPGTLLPRQQGFTDFISVAAADLDDIEGPDGNLHDEAIVADVTGEDSQHYGYDIDVLNYGSGQIQSPDMTTSHFVDYKPKIQYSPQNNLSGLLPSDNVLAVVTGDFQGNGKREIAVLALGDGTLLLYTLAYDTVGGTHTLKFVGSQYFRFNDFGDAWKFKPIVGTVAAAAAAELDVNVIAPQPSAQTKGGTTGKRF